MIYPKKCSSLLISSVAPTRGIRPLRKHCGGQRVSGIQAHSLGGSGNCLPQQSFLDRAQTCARMMCRCEDRPLSQCIASLRSGREAVFAQLNRFEIVVDSNPEAPQTGTTCARVLTRSSQQGRAPRVEQKCAAIDLRRAGAASPRRYECKSYSANTR